MSLNPDCLVQDLCIWNESWFCVLHYVTLHNELKWAQPARKLYCYKHTGEDVSTRNTEGWTRTRWGQLIAMATRVTGSCGLVKKNFLAYILYFIMTSKKIVCVFFLNNVKCVCIFEAANLHTRVTPLLYLHVRVFLFVRVPKSLWCHLENPECSTLSHRAPSSSSSFWWWQVWIGMKNAPFCFTGAKIIKKKD